MFSGCHNKWDSEILVWQVLHRHRAYFDLSNAACNAACNAAWGERMKSLQAASRAPLSRTPDFPDVSWRDTSIFNLSNFIHIPNLQARSVWEVSLTDLSKSCSHSRYNQLVKALYSRYTCMEAGHGWTVMGYDGLLGSRDMSRRLNIALKHFETEDFCRHIVDPLGRDARPWAIHRVIVVLLTGGKSAVVTVAINLPKDMLEPAR